MMMPFVARNEGFSAFVAIGLKWPETSVRQEEGNQSLSRGEGLPRPVIDVDVNVGESGDSSKFPSRFLKLTTFENDPLLRAYALPNGPSQAPRLLYRTSSPGQLIDTFA